MERDKLDRLRFDRDMAAAKIVGVITELIRLGRLDPLKEVMPHTYADLCSFVLDHQLASEAITAFITSTPLAEEA
jgi:hypothetical protein